MIVSPRDAFYNPKKTVRLEDSDGEIAGEMVMAYPPGIPVICLGERITKDMIDYIKILKEERCQLQGTSDPHVDYIRVLGSLNYQDYSQNNQPCTYKSQKGHLLAQEQDCTKNSNKG